MTRRIFATVAALPLVLALPGHAAAAPGNGARLPARSLVDLDRDKVSDGLESSIARARPGERRTVIVTFDGTVDVGAARHAAPGLEIRRVWSIIDAFSATVPASQVRSLAHVPGVHRVEENGTVRATNDASNLSFGTSAARSDFGVDGTGVGVCITDTGVDSLHEQLDAGKIAGWVDYVGGSPTPFDDNGHGSHVANIAAGSGTGGSSAATFKGVAPGAALYIAKVLDGGGSGSFEQVIDGVQWCASQPGVGVISMSLGAGPSDGTDSLSNAVNEAVTVNNKVVVVASGNEGDDTGTVGTPGTAAEAITVGAAAEHSAPAGSERYSEGLYLAPFSSRGPTLDGRTKPEVVGPGVSVTAAQAGTTEGYVTYSGTSMATPFVAGTVALALQRGTAPGDIRSLVQTTSADWGSPGQDNDFGWGFLDGHRLVAEAGGGSGGTNFGVHTFLSASVPNDGEWTHDFTVGSDGLGVPIAVTMLIDGSKRCVFRFFGACLQYEWRPDVDIEILEPGGGQLVLSQCALGDECGIGRQETPHAMPTVPGTYTLRVFPFAGAPNNGQGGSFTIDLSHGPLGPPPPPPSLPPVADAGTDVSATDHDGSGAETLALDGTGSNDPDGGSIVTYSWSEGGAEIATGPTPSVPFPVGSHTVTLTVTDDEGDPDTDTVLLTVAANPLPTANAGPDQTLTDADDTGSETVSLDGTASTDPGGTIASYSWSEGGSEIATGANPAETFAVGTHTVTLTVTDNGGAGDDDTVVITVEPAPPPPPPTNHVGDLDGSSANNGKTWTATVTIRIHDAAHGAVSGATVSGTWSGGATGSASCLTDATGSCSVQMSGIAKKKPSATFTVANVTHASSSYSSGDNHETDGDSTGSAITVFKP